MYNIYIEEKKQKQHLQHEATKLHNHNLAKKHKSTLPLTPSNSKPPKTGNKLPRTHKKLHIRHVSRQTANPH